MADLPTRNRCFKVSTSVPEAWADRFYAPLPELVAGARTLNDVPPQF